MAHLGDGLNGYLDVENATLRAPRLEAVSNIGIANTSPEHAFSVGSNLYVSINSPDVLTVDGNVVCEGIKVGFIEILPSYDLAAVSNVGNVTQSTIQFANTTTAFVTTANVEVGTANLFVDTTTSRVGVNTATPDASLHVTGNAYVSSNLEVGTANLFVDSVGNKVGIGTTTPLAVLDVDGNIKSRGNLYLAPGTLETNTKVGTSDTFLLMHHSTFTDQLGPNHPLPECGTIMTNRSGGGTFPWLMYTGLVKDVATTTPATSLRMDWGQGSSTGAATNLVDATLNPLMTLRFSGELGIGTTNPDTLLHLEDSVPILRFVDTDTVVDVNQVLGGLEFYSRDSTADGYPTYELASMKCINSANAGSAPDGELTFSTGRNVGTGILERMRINADGNVGIGTDAPANTMHIYKASNDQTTGLFIEKATGASGTASLFFGVTADAGETNNVGIPKAGILFQRTASNGRGDLKFCVDYVDDTNAVGVADAKMTIAGSSGNVGIGTDNPHGYGLLSPNRSCIGQLAIAHRTGASTSLTQVSHSNGSDRIFQFTLNSLSSWTPGFFKMKVAVVNNNGSSGYAWDWEAGFKVIDNNNSMDMMTTMSGADPGSSWFSRAWNGSTRVLTLTAKDAARTYIIAEATVVFYGGIKD